MVWPDSIVCYVNHARARDTIECLHRRVSRDFRTPSTVIFTHPGPVSISIYEEVLLHKLYPCLEVPVHTRDSATNITILFRRPARVKKRYSACGTLFVDLLPSSRSLRVAEMGVPVEGNILSRYAGGCRGQRNLDIVIQRLRIQDAAELLSQ